MEKINTTKKEILNTKNYEINGIYEIEDGKELLISFETILKNDLKDLFDKYMMVYDGYKGPSIYLANLNNEIIKISNNLLVEKTDSRNIKKVILVSSKEITFILNNIWYFDEYDVFYDYEKDIDNFEDEIKETIDILEKIENILNREKKDSIIKTFDEIKSIFEDEEEYNKYSY